MKNDITESTLLEYFNGELSPVEEGEVREWVHSCDENCRVFRKVQKEHLRLSWGVRAPLIKGCTDLYKPAARRKANLSWVAVAAVSVAVVAVASSLILFRGSSPPGGDDIASVQQPHDRIVLELSDGSQYVVDTSADARLTEQDGTQVAITDGNIVYDKGTDSSEQEVIYNKVLVPRGTNPYRMLLADGTAVWLNADSRLEYPISFTDGERRVILTGEAYFDVAPDVAKPFIVESGGQRVIVSGTEFNISVYPGETVTTTLVSGKVRVYAANDGQGVALFPGQQLLYDVASGNIRIAEVKAEDYTAWMNGTLSVEKLTFSDVLGKVSRKYDVEFELPDEDKGNIVLRGTISGKENFETVLSILGKAADVEFKMNRDGKIKVVNL